MDLRTREADRALDAFRASRSVEGRFLSYCRGRSRHFWTRQIIVLILFPVFLVAGGWKVAVAAAMAVLLGEALDCLILRRIGRRSALGDHLPLAMGTATLTGGVQAITVATCVALVYGVGEGDTRTLASALCFAGILDAALLYSAHRGASIVRISVYILTLTILLFYEWSASGGTDPGLAYDFISVLFLVYVCWVTVAHVFKTQERRNATRMDTLENARELAHTNAALEQSRQTTKRLAMVAERANDSVVITDQGGTITWVNRAFSKATGYSFAEAVGRHVTFLDGPQTDAAASGELSQARAERRPLRIEIVNHHKDGHPVWTEVNMCPLFDETGELLNIVSIERDIGEAKERERALAEARRLAEEAVRARHNFLATMSHEIRTPMNGVIGTLDLLLDSSLDAHQQSLVRTISSSGEALLAIVNDILDFSKLEAGRLEVSEDPFSLKECIRAAIDLVQPLADAKGLVLELVLPSSLPPFVLGDGRRLGQVMLNLLGNAIKFTEAGRVRVEVSVLLKGRRSSFTIAVRDTGIGIAPERLEGIFDSFAQADSTVAGRFGGTGLGLSISRLLVNAMGGEISVSSRPGAGSVFFVSLELPLAEMEAEAHDPDETPVPRDRADADLEGVKVLVAEDNRTNALLLERMLAGTGAEPVFTVNGREAVGQYRDQVPDIVLMDVHMPILDGLAATREIRTFEKMQGLPPAPIIALTANAFPEDRELCLSAGMDGIVTKPFRKKDLQAAIGSLLAGAADRSIRYPVHPPLRRSG